MSQKPPSPYKLSPASLWAFGGATAIFIAVEAGLVWLMFNGR